MPFSHFSTISGKLDGALITGLPNFIPLAFAAAMPYACRFRIFSRSFCATKDRTCKRIYTRNVPIKSLPRRVCNKEITVYIYDISSSPGGEAAVNSHIKNKV